MIMRLLIILFNVPYNMLHMQVPSHYVNIVKLKTHSYVVNTPLGSRCDVTVFAVVAWSEIAEPENI